MKKYSVAPNKDTTAWMVKLEDVAPTDSFQAKDDAIAEAEKMAKENSPSKVMVLDKNHEIIETKTY
ncbi:hypothetical protein JOC34_001769 [Virgibacillus halotolerans]|uniref:DUF2188 domain-containing protein n=1 Tax=Virgibacillus halotolerans TaxID=1071053 RepID=UPI0019602DCC|nr:DUF2188 domain-containing protein [Virgibacillus halotolerans]MBM7599401.1 hypothetical protein [Virgibacillus halotolerans]